MHSITINGWSFDALMTPAEVAAAFRVDPRTVTRWANLGRLVSLRTLGGSRRYSTEQVSALLSGAAALPEQRDDLSGHTVTVEYTTSGRWIVERTDGALGTRREPSDRGVPVADEARSYAEMYGAVYVPAGGAE